MKQTECNWEPITANGFFIPWLLRGIPATKHYCWVERKARHCSRKSILRIFSKATSKRDHCWRWFVFCRNMERACKMQSINGGSLYVDSNTRNEICFLTFCTLTALLASWAILSVSTCNALANGRHCFSVILPPIMMSRTSRGMIFQSPSAGIAPLAAFPMLEPDYPKE